MTKPGPKPLRCAIYTRVSTDHGLEQDFNSLQAQREAAEAYVKSQAHEGWRLVQEHFEDGGFSGGSLDRPALQRLLAAIRSRLIDVVVVYKVDRLTRSLADFAKLVEIFEAEGVSFVSVTQSFNTTTSMGRLTLNMLLSFAQFEREVTGERIRDKIAASKRKGIWVGGIVPLGYEVRERKLVIREDEAAMVRLIFERYRALGSLPALQRELRERGIVTRRRTLSSGQTIGGVPLTNGPLGYLLRNRVYLGELNHRGGSYPGQHAPVITPALFDAVQDKLTANRNGARGQRAASGALLLGRIFDDRGNRMTPSTAKKGAIRYRYYLSSVLAQGRTSEAGSVRRASAPEVEALLVNTLRSTHPEDADLDEGTLIRTRVARIVLRAGSIDIHAASDPHQPIVVPWSPKPPRSQRAILRAAGTATDFERGIKAEARTVLLRSIALARRWLDEVLGGSTLDEIAVREGCTTRHVAKTIPLAFLAPDLVQALIEARLPRGFSTKRIGAPELEWARQWERLGVRR
jgi:DNA invertase Pin-like site-specific DNA recombinase